MFVRGSYEDVQFDDGATAPDFDQTDLLGGYSVEGARTNLLAEAGYSKLKTEFGTRAARCSDCRWGAS